MQTLKIGSGGDLTQIKELMLKSALSDKIGKISFENDDGIVSEISLTINEEDKIRFCDILSGWIMNKYEGKMVSRIINRDFCEFPIEDRREFFKTAQARLENSHKDYFKTVIRSSLSEYFEDCDRICVEGFVRFRIKEYCDYIKDTVEESVEDLLIEREYDEFLGMLRDFVREQKSEMDFLHVIATKDKKYKFYNRFETDISSVCVKEFLSDNMCTEINYDDLLISTLIVLTPKKIMLHKSERIENTEIVKTISEIFGDKLIVCKGCELCNKRKKDV